MKSLRSGSVAACLLVAIVLLAACGSKSSKASSTTTAAATDTSSFCKSFQTANGLSSDTDIATTKATFAQLDAAAPAGVKSDFDAVNAKVQAASTTNDLTIAAVGDSQFQPTMDRITNWVKANCGFDPNASGSSTTTSSAASSSTGSPTVTQLPGQTATSVAFLSPTGNIACQIDTNPAAGSVDGHGNAIKSSAECQTTKPDQSASVAEDGTVTECSATQPNQASAGPCAGNPGDNTPTLAYGNQVVVAPFRCISATDGVTCALIQADGPGKGFRISRSGIVDTGSDSASAGSVDNCTESQLSAALPAGMSTGLVWNSAGGFGCAGGYAFAFPTQHSPSGPDITVTALFQLQNGTWVKIDRAQPCQDHSVPAAIYQPACGSN